MSSTIEFGPGGIQGERLAGAKGGKGFAQENSMTSDITFDKNGRGSSSSTQSSNQNYGGPPGGADFASSAVNNDDYGDTAFETSGPAAGPAASDESDEEYDDTVLSESDEDPPLDDYKDSSGPIEGGGSIFDAGSVEIPVLPGTSFEIPTTSCSVLETYTTYSVLASTFPYFDSC